MSQDQPITDADEIDQIEAKEKTFDLEDKYDFIWYIEEWVFVQPFFTEVGAQNYININGHNLREPRIYVESGYRNDEWATIRTYLEKLV